MRMEISVGRASLGPAGGYRESIGATLTEIPTRGDIKTEVTTCCCQTVFFFFFHLLSKTSCYGASVEVKGWLVGFSSLVLAFQHVNSRICLRSLSSLGTDMGHQQAR